METCFNLFLAFVSTHSNIGWVLGDSDWLFTWNQGIAGVEYFAYNQIPNDSNVKLKVIGECKLETGKIVNLYGAIYGLQR